MRALGNHTALRTAASTPSTATGATASWWDVGPVPDAPALKSAEILEETRLPRVFDPAQAAEVDEVLDQTVAGGPTLPEFFALNEVATSEESAASC